MVRLLMERQELEQRDLITQFGSECSVSMFLLGQRKRTLEQVRTFTMPAQSESELCGCNVRTGPPAPNFPFSSPRSFENALQAVSLSQTAFKSFVAQSLPKASLYPPSKLNIQNPVLSQVAQRSPKLGNSNTGLSSANTASLEFQAIATLQGTSRTDDCSSGRVLSCDVQTHQCPSSPANVSSASRLRQRRWDVLRPSDNCQTKRQLQQNTGNHRWRLLPSRAARVPCLPSLE